MSMGRHTVRTGARLEEMHRGATSVCIVMSGRFKLSYRKGSAREVIIGFAGAGDTYGEVAGPKRPQSAHSAVALIPSVVALLDHRRFEAALDQHATLSRLLVRHLADRQEQANDLIAGFASRSAEARLTQLMYDLAVRFGQAHPQGRLVDHYLSQRELADCVGVSRETVSRLMNALATQGHITFRHGWVLVSHDLMNCTKYRGHGRQPASA
jgi:CRP/FNR family transcriptional regulator